MIFIVFISLIIITQNTFFFVVNSIINHTPCMGCIYYYHIHNSFN